MIHYIENEQLKIGVKEQGCELTSIFSKKDNTERLWQGDKSIWNGQSPILFPVIGRLLDDKYILDGKEYEMPKHGFARNLQWSLKEKSEYVTLTSDNHNRKIRFNLGGAPYLGIWAKPGAPYVCIEPWYGLNDTPERKADLSLKTGINALSEKEEFNFTWSAEII